MTIVTNRTLGSLTRITTKTTKATTGANPNSSHHTTRPSEPRVLPNSAPRRCDYSTRLGKRKPHTAAMPVDVDDIPTLPSLYSTHKLRPPTYSLVDPLPSSNINSRVSLYHGDITELAVDAIVNAANRQLSGGGGVDGAIHNAAGPRLIEECATLNGCATGCAKITRGYGLPAKRVIHAVGPIFSNDKPAQMAALLRGCYQTSLELAVTNGLRTVAFSAISTGIYGYPPKDAAEVAVGAVREFMEGDQGASLTRVVFVTFADKDVAAYNEVLPRFFPPEAEPRTPVTNDQ